MTIDHTRGNQVSLRWLLYDGHGNLVRTMAPDYTLSAFQWRGVWGEVQSSLGVGRGYCANLGHPEDETGLVYMRARYYEPATSRFISEDPARDGVNWYLYADGNPVAKVDEDGKKVSTADFNLFWQFMRLLRSWGFPIPDSVVASARLFGALYTYGRVAGYAIAAALSIAAVLAAATAPLAALGLGIALAVSIAIIGLAFTLAVAEMADWAANPDLYARGESTYRLEL